MSGNISREVTLQTQQTI